MSDATPFAPALAATAPATKGRPLPRLAIGISSARPGAVLAPCARTNSFVADVAIEQVTRAAFNLLEEDEEKEGGL